MNASTSDKVHVFRLIILLLTETDIITEAIVRPFQTLMNTVHSASSEIRGKMFVLRNHNPLV